MSGHPSHSALSSVTSLNSQTNRQALPPRLPAAHVARPRLAQLLLASDCRLRLLCSPAGFGKTVLLNECARQLPADTTLLWLELGGRPLTPKELLSRLAAALHKSPGEGEVYSELLGLLSAIDQPLWIMLDDYPRESCAELDACLDRLLEQGPGSLRWWVSSRRQPAWNLPRLLLQGDLLELDARELALTATELAQLVALQKLDLSQDSFDELLLQSEGWLAGVCLLLLNGNEQALRERLIAGTPFLREYIAREVLAGLGDELKGALFALAQLPRFSPALCEHVLDAGGSELLRELRERQLFIRPLDSCGEWFCLWRPLAHMLRRLPEAPPPAQVHVRACQWFAGQGDIREAVEHALLAGQLEVAANYLQRYGQEQLLVGQSVSQFLQWRTELPQWLFSSTPRLNVLQGWALILCAQLDEAEVCIANLGRFLPQANARRQRMLLAEGQALNATLARQRGQKNVRQQCLEALEELPEASWTAKVICYQMLAQQAMVEIKLDEAQHYSDKGLKLARLNRSVAFEALLTVDRVRLLKMTGETQAALDLIELSLLHLPPTGPMLGRLLLQRGDLLTAQGLEEDAREAFQRGLVEAEACEDAYTIFGYLGLSELAACEGNLSAAFQWLSEAERLMQWRHVPEVHYRSMLQLARGVLWLRQGESGKARETFERMQQHYQSKDLQAPSGFFDLLPRLRRLLALTDLAQGHFELAINALRTLLNECVQAGHLGFACECRFSLAEALFVSGRQDEAEHELRQALAESQRQTFLKPLQELQRRQPQWLEKILPAHKGASLRERLFAQRSELEPELMSEKDDRSVLSARELAVLRLISQGCSNQEIAEQLFISLHTVKTHARRINTKLGVARRTQAVAQAKVLGLLS
ncbi:helix-turn-helix transcriptional regulator [Pseudomonas cavernicola]|uniref:Helix-turn-helix transcriptional regulator n=1 Tax=Pseudomonas cavernicola TaxID=2320866 RepID=A0A418XDE6_9PSED|nr:LuxR C-terminal-related transcriptional regulator [Pseudomonas cavernicola]RJG10363.1 helix-turn-helix transcriptional regulator [Pseudomonas cavernicola]